MYDVVMDQQYSQKLLRGLYEPLLLLESLGEVRGTSLKKSPDFEAEDFYA